MKVTLSPEVHVAALVPYIPVIVILELDAKMAVKE
jgi:hypothetical protein